MGNIDYAFLGNLIKEKRKEKNLTQQGLAEAIGKTESSIRKYEKGLVQIPNDVLSKIAETLGLNLKSLLVSSLNVVNSKEKALELSRTIVKNGIEKGMYLSIDENSDRESIENFANKVSEMLQDFPAALDYEYGPFAYIIEKSLGKTLEQLPKESRELFFNNITGYIKLLRGSPSLLPDEYNENIIEKELLTAIKKTGKENLDEKQKKQFQKYEDLLNVFRESNKYSIEVYKILIKLMGKNIDQKVADDTIIELLKELTPFDIEILLKINSMKVSLYGKYVNRKKGLIEQLLFNFEKFSKEVVENSIDNLLNMKILDREKFFIELPIYIGDGKNLITEIGMKVISTIKENKKHIDTKNNILNGEAVK